MKNESEAVAAQQYALAIIMHWSEYGQCRQRADLVGLYGVPDIEGNVPLIQGRFKTEPPIEGRLQVMIWEPRPGARRAPRVIYGDALRDAWLHPFDEEDEEEGGD